MSGEWIETEFELPLKGQIVLCCDIYNKFISLGKYSQDEDAFLLMNIEGVEVDSYPTHWMELPKLPIKKEM